MREGKPLTDEEARILRAADRGALRVNGSGRYVIDGEARPDRKSRERMFQRGYLGWKWTMTRLGRVPQGTEAIILTPDGLSALRRGGGS